MKRIKDTFQKSKLPFKKSKLLQNFRSSADIISKYIKLRSNYICNWNVQGINNIIIPLWGLILVDFQRLSFLYKRDNFCGFLFTVFAHQAPSEKGSTLKGKSLLPNSSLLE